MSRQVGDNRLKKIQEELQLPMDSLSAHTDHTSQRGWAEDLALKTHRFSSLLMGYFEVNDRRLYSGCQGAK